MRHIIGIFVVSRVFLILGLILIKKTLWGEYPPTLDQIAVSNPLLNMFTLYDSFNYAHIAVNGYDEDRYTVFFPLLPLLTRVGVWAGLNVFVTGVILSNLFFLGSLWAFDQTMKQRGMTEKMRTPVLWVLAFFPSSYYFSAFYTESLFLFLALLAFWMWGKEKRGWAYIIGGIATSTRITGVFVPLAFFVERMIHKKLTGSDVGYSFVSFLIFISYPFYLWLVKGDPLVFLKSQAYYGRRAGFPLEGLWQELKNIIEYHTIQPLILCHFLLVGMIVVYLIYAFPIDHHWADTIFVLGSVIMPLSTVVMLTSHIATHGLIRYVLPAFPLFIFWGSKWSEWRKSQSVEAILIVGFILVVWTMVTLYNFSILSIKGFLA